MTTPAATACLKAVRRALLFLAFAAPSFAQSIDVDALLRKLDDARVQYNVAGVSIAIVDRNGPIHLGGLGVADRATRRPVDADTLFRIGSVTKMFTGVAMLMGEADGLFQIDDPVSTHVQHVPFRNGWEATRPVRIAHLLEHTAGLSDLTRKEFDSSDPKPLSIEEAFAVEPASRDIRWPPGMHSSYSNTGAGIAAYVLEQKSGLSYESFVSKRIFEPLEMLSAGFRLDDNVRRSLATGYDFDGTTAIPYWHVLYRAFGGINASARDMATFTRWLLNRGLSSPTLLSQAAFQRMEHPRTTLAARSGLTYGYGLGIYSYAHRGHVFYGHGGDGDGYLSRLGYSRELGVGYFFSINAYKSDALSAMQAIVEDAITATTNAPAKPARAHIEKDALAALSGCYIPITKRFVDANESDDEPLLIRVDKDGLSTSTPGGRTRALIPVTDRHFRRSDETIATSAFVSDETGDLYLQGDMGNLKRISTSPSGPCVVTNHIR